MSVCDRMILPGPPPRILRGVRRSRLFRSLVERACVVAELGLWRVLTRVDVYGDDIDEFRARDGKHEGEARFFREARLIRTTTSPWNLFTYGGVSCIWESLVGNGTTSTNQPTTYFNNANSYIGVGDSTAAEAATQTDLQATTNKYRQVADATFPQHTDGTASGSASITYRSTFGGGVANFTWAEWAHFNASAGGRMLARKVEARGVKAAGTSAAFTIIHSIA